MHNARNALMLDLNRKVTEKMWRMDRQFGSCEILGPASYTIVINSFGSALTSPAFCGGA